jgi:PAS domain S-box-containing protein
MAIAWDVKSAAVAAELARELEEARDRERVWMRSERELRDFVENAVVGLHKVGPDGTILWANAADWELLGYTRDEYIGRNIAEFHADQTNLCAILQTLLAGQALRERPATLRCKDGSLRHVLISSNSHFEAGRFVNTRCFTRDVTAQVRAEAELRQAREHLAAIVESSDDAILAVDLEGRITSWNRGAQAAYGYSPEEAIGKPIFIIVPPESHDEERRIAETIRSGGRVAHYETVRLTRDGRRLDVSLTASPIPDADGRLIGISKVGRDITERKRAQRALAEETRRKDEFLAILAHELRNPLAPVRYALTITRQPNCTPEQRGRAEAVIARQVEQMARLLDDLLDVSRIARGHVELRRRTTDLTSVIGAAIEAARPLIDEKHHALELELPREALRLDADPVRLTQILSNLLTNAAKYTDPGGRIQVRASSAGGWLELAVRDNGMGLAPEMIPRLFTLFSQAEPALKRSQGGLGIGLALVRGFAEMHGGTVEARSAGPGQGSEFIVRLPVGAAIADQGAGESAAACPVNSARLRVLVADDNEDSAQTCAVLLELWGHEVKVAHGGRQALELARTFEPHIALLDIGMPDMSGYELAKAMRAQAWGKRATLVAVTGWGQDDDRQKASSAGFDHHLTKPVDPERIQPLLEPLLVGCNHQP